MHFRMFYINCQCFKSFTRNRIIIEFYTNLHTIAFSSIIFPTLKTVKSFNIAIFNLSFTTTIIKKCIISLQIFLLTSIQNLVFFNSNIILLFYRFFIHQSIYLYPSIYLSIPGIRRLI